MSDPLSANAQPASAIYDLETIVEPLDLSVLFSVPQPIEVELGSGDGSFLVSYATAYPQTNFIGVERLLGRIQKTDRKARRANLQNLRLIRIESSYFLRYLLPAGVTSALHIYFPDPWPKKRHRRHRLINEHFPAIARHALAEQGKVYLRTDDADYFGQMTEVFDGDSLFERAATSVQLLEFQTDFEADFRADGVVMYQAAYSLISV